MILALMLAAAAAKDQGVLDPGPAPTFVQAVALGNEALRAQLIDPASAQIEWPYALEGGTMKAFLGRKRPGWYTCGFVNSRNRMGGYSGRAPFLVLFHNGAVASLDIGTVSGEDTASVTCPGLIKTLRPSGYSPVASAMPIAPSMMDPAAYQAAASQSANVAASSGGIGIAFQPTPVGALIMAVAPGSPAEKSGLKPGEVIESVNGVSIKGFPAAAAMQAIRANTPVISYGVVGVGEVKIAKPGG